MAVLETRTIKEVKAALDALAGAAKALDKASGGYDLFDKYCVTRCRGLVEFITGGGARGLRPAHMPHHDVVLVTSGLLSATLRFAISLLLTRSNAAVSELRKALEDVERLEADVGA
jgi:hypothetical protein